MSRSRIMNEILKEGEILLRHGKSTLVRETLKHLKPSSLDRRSIADVASLARRCGLSSLAVRWLNPLVRPPIPGSVVATTREKAEYAAALVKLGAAEEALNVLEPLSADEAPEVLLYRTFALTPQWRYAETIEPLTKYLQYSLSPYQQIVGKINLAAAQIYERHPDARATLEEVIQLARRHAIPLMYGHALELGAQLSIAAKDWAEAERYLERAERALFQIPSPYDLFIRKWRVALDLSRNGASAPTLECLRLLRAQATDVRHWETVRDLDRLQAIHFLDETLLAKVYAGTPYSGYRQRLLEQWGIAWTPPMKFDWRPGASSSGDKLLDLSDNEPFRAASVERRTGSDPLVQRVLTVLASDFYQSFRLGTLHFRLYPSEYFNPESSPDRVHQALKRARRWLEDSGHPLQLQETDGAYRLTSDSCLTVRVSLERTSSQTEDDGLETLRQHLAAHPFSVQEAVGVLNFPKRSTQRLLQTACDQGRLERVGAGKATRYRFAA